MENLKIANFVKTFSFFFLVQTWICIILVHNVYIYICFHHPIDVKRYILSWTTGKTSFILIALTFQILGLKTHFGRELIVVKLLQNLTLNCHLCFSLGFHCKTYKRVQTLFAPSINHNNTSCLLQEEPLLYSCRASNPFVTRLCPCRSYIKEQAALCQSCL